MSDLTATDSTGDATLGPVRDRRAELRARRNHALLKLMDEREDLRGVHPLADLVADSLRWSA